MASSITPAIVASLLLCSSSTANAAIVHKWIDADGVTHYSDEAPISDETPVTLIDVEASATVSKDTEAAKDDYYSILKQWQRMHRERSERDRLNLEKARLKAMQTPAEPQVVYVNEPEQKRYVTAYPGFFHRKSGHHRFHRKFKRHYGGDHRKYYRNSRVGRGSFPHLK
jgi:hypothetical protein